LRRAGTCYDAVNAARLKRFVRGGTSLGVASGVRRQRPALLVVGFTGHVPRPDPSLDGGELRAELQRHVRASLTGGNQVRAAHDSCIAESNGTAEWQPIRRDARE
jgi:hypothetical protein